MNTDHLDNSAATATDPLTAQLPLSAPLGETERPPKERTTSLRPFGLRFACAPRTHAPAPDLTRTRFNPQTQTAEVYTRGEWLPLLDPRLGLTLHTTGEVPREDEIHDKA